MPVRYLYQILEQDKVLVLLLKVVNSDLLPWPKIHKVYIVNCLLDFGLCCPCLPFALLNFHSRFFLPASVCRVSSQGSADVTQLKQNCMRKSVASTCSVLGCSECKRELVPGITILIVEGLFRRKFYLR